MDAAAQQCVSNNAADQGVSRSVDDARQALLANVPQGWAAGPVQMFASSRLHPDGTESHVNLGGSGVDAQTAQILDEFRLSSIYKRTFQRGRRFLHVTVYQFSAPAGAYGAYNLLRQGATTVVVRGDGSSEDDHSISFWKGNFFVKLIQTSEDDEESKDALRLIADRLVNAIGSHAAMPRIFQEMPVMDRVRGSEKMVMGPVSGRLFFRAPGVSELSLDRARSAATADYQFQRPTPERLKLLYIDYGDAGLAYQVYERYLDNLEDDHAVSRVSAADGPTSIVKVDRGFLCCQVRGSKLLVISGARKRSSPLVLARQIK